MTATRLGLPRRYKRTTDTQWRTETLSALEACTEQIRELEARRRDLLVMAKGAGNPVWLLAAASGYSRAHLYRLFPDVVKEQS